jgi:hypothetical protein
VLVQNGNEVNLPVYLTRSLVIITAFRARALGRRLHVIDDDDFQDFISQKLLRKFSSCRFSSCLTIAARQNVSAVNSLLRQLIAIGNLKCCFSLSLSCNTTCAHISSVGCTRRWLGDNDHSVTVGLRCVEFINVSFHEFQYLCSRLCPLTSE